MKCDETRPICGPCKKASRECVYGSANAGLHASRNTGVGQQCRSSPTPNPAPADQPQASAPDQRSTFTAVSSGTEAISPLIQQWPNTPISGETYSPQSAYSSSSTYGVEVAPLRWYSLLAGDVASEASNDLPLDLSDAAFANRYRGHLGSISAIQRHLHDSVVSQNSPRTLRPPALSPRSNNESIDEQSLWQCHSIQLEDHEVDIFERFVNGVGLWLDLFDPQMHFTTYCPHLALHNGSYDYI